MNNGAGASGNGIVPAAPAPRVDTPNVPGTAGEPALILQYGTAGTHKSTVAGELAAYGGVGLAPPTGMEPVWTYLRIPMVAFGAEQFAQALPHIPKLVADGYFVTIQPRTLLEALSWLPYLRQIGIWCVILDDVSLFAHDQVYGMKQVAQQELQMKVAVAAAKGQKMAAKEIDTRKLYGEFGDTGVLFRQIALALGLVIVVNAHEKEDEASGHISPDFPGRVMAKQLTHGASVVVRSATHPAAWGEGGIAHWCTAGKCEAKNRLAIGGAPTTVQPSLRALLVDTGRKVPRHPKLAWMDTVMHDVARRLEEGTPYPEIVKKFSGWGVAQGLEPAHIAWALREGHSLGQYRLHRVGGANYWNSLTVAPAALSQPGPPPPAAARAGTGGPGGLPALPAQPPAATVGG